MEEKRYEALKVMSLEAEVRKLRRALQTIVEAQIQNPTRAPSPYAPNKVRAAIFAAAGCLEGGMLKAA